MRQTYKRGIMTARGRSRGTGLRRLSGRSLGRLVGTEWIRQSGLAVDGDDWDAPPVFVAVARQLRISAQIIFFQRKEGVRSRKGARACG